MWYRTSLESPQCMSYYQSATRNIGFQTDFPPRVTFETLFLHCRNELLADEACRMALVSSLFAGHVEVARVKRAIRLVLHRLSSRTPTARDLLLLLASIVDGLQNVGRIADARSIVLFCFDCETMKTLSARPLQAEIREGEGLTEHSTTRCSLCLGLGKVLDASFKVGGDDIIQLSTSMTSKWVLTLRESLDNLDEDQVRISLPMTSHGPYILHAIACDCPSMAQVHGRAGSTGSLRISDPKSRTLELSSYPRSHRWSPRGDGECHQS